MEQMLIWVRRNLCCQSKDKTSERIKGRVERGQRERERKRRKRARARQKEIMAGEVYHRPSVWG